MKKNILLTAILALVLTFNYTTNSFNQKNEMFDSFQQDSESLVLDMINARNDGIQDTGRYGLGHYNTSSSIILEPSRYIMHSNAISSYTSSYGLQGWIFQFLRKLPGKHTVCAFATGFVLVLIVLLIKKKYDTFFAFVFFITFLLSPWIINFARNLYWVEFTWFIPMLIGIYISLNYENKTKKIICYLAILISICIKCLCGYEYITVIMLAMIAFPLVDMIEAFTVTHENKKAFLIFKTILIMGIISLIGFSVALIIHSNVRGNGDIIHGLKIIYKNDVLRRTLGGNPNNFSVAYTSSLESSIIEVVLRYYNFYTEIIAGISGKHFILLNLLPIFIFAYQIHKKKIHHRDVIMFIVFYLTCISWFILGKAHSYIHTHMNYVLWYFGYIQMCFYVILKQLIEFLKMAIRYYIENRSNIKKRILEKIYE